MSCLNENAIKMIGADSGVEQAEFLAVGSNLPFLRSEPFSLMPPWGRSFGPGSSGTAFRSSSPGTPTRSGR